MSLNIVVCIKQVPDPEHFSKITLDPKTHAIRREGIPAITNPLDRHALEEALRIRERFPGKITVISMGPPQARQALEDALAMGADDAALLTDRAFAGADTLATAYCLACAIKKLKGFDLILCGNSTVDGATGQVGAQLAELLSIPHVTFVNKIDFVSEKSLMVIQALEYGYLKIEANLPCLLCVTHEINQFQLPSVLGIMEASSKEIKVWGCRDIEAQQEAIGLAGSPTRVAEAFEHKSKRGGLVLEGSPKEIAHQAVRKLRELGAI